MFLVNKISVPNMIHQPLTVLEKWNFQYFPHINSLESQFNLFAGKARSSWDHHFNKFGRPQVINVLYKVSRFSVSWFWRRFSKGTYMNMAAFLVSRLKPFE